MVFITVFSSFLTNFVPTYFCRPITSMFGLGVTMERHQAPGMHATTSNGSNVTPGQDKGRLHLIFYTSHTIPHIITE